MPKTTFLILLGLLGILLVASGGALVFHGARYVLHPAHGGAVSLLLEVEVLEAQREGAADADSALAGCVEVLAQRLDALGVSRPRVGVDDLLPHRIRIEMPAAEDPERVAELLTNRGELELTLVEQEGAASQEALLSLFGGSLPEDLEALCGQPEDVDPPCIAVHREPVITGRDLEIARPSTGQLNEPVVSFRLTSSAGERFRGFTAANIGRRLAILYNGLPLSTPTIQDAIGRDGVIHGNFSMEEVFDLASVLRSGRLPAPVRLIETEPIPGTPWLRHELIRAGLAALALVVCVAMIASLIWRRFRIPWVGGPASSD